MDALQGIDFDLSLTAFDEKEQAAFVQHGDIWSVGKHRLMCGITQVEVSTIMLHNESRELVVEAYEKTHDAFS